MPLELSENDTAWSANGFLASLSPLDRKLLEPLLVRVRCGNGERLGGIGTSRDMVFFPVTLVACLQFAHQRCGVGLVGREGIVGWGGVLGDPAEEDLEATVLMEGGWALAISVKDMLGTCLASATFSLALLRFLQSFTSQLGWMIRARDCGNFRQRLCAWLLMLHDRVDSDFLQLTHRGLARQLGVRRASVTDALHILEGEGCLKCTRGMIYVMDRSLLERHAGVSYMMPRTPPIGAIVAATRTRSRCHMAT
ncbi:Crp/Fnr family transcriptional regulator [Aurantiacibacter luteus]|uniref:Crp/Fnr family transcriptional regulator n=1 Tax=Aurantiacibacter luteus TaxID=1581420 RepID=UPI00069A58AE|nr:helix-turn-helix domain-containing protein [Aurantiacibacter luteus]